MTDFRNNKAGIPNEDAKIITDWCKIIDTEYALGLLKVDDVRVRLSKLYNLVAHKDSKKVVLMLYDGLEKVEQK